MNNLIKQSFIAEFKVFEYDSLENTISLVKKHKPNTVIMTQDQKSAKGKGNRTWTTYAGNLYFSFNLATQNKSKDYSQLSFLSAVAMKEALLSLPKNNTKIECKWPNDVMLNRKKFCGILLQFEPQKNQLIIGIGANIKHFPKTGMYKTTSTHNEGFTNLKAPELLEKFLLKFSNLYKIWQNYGFKKIRRKWLESAFKFKKEIVVKSGKNKFTGIFENLDEDGTLILKLNNGAIKEIKSGDIF